MYYLHYAISIVGLDDNQDILKDAMRKMAFLCERFNRNDFAVGLISNYADRTKIYDDPKLIYFYQSCLLNSYNGKLSYDDPERFCKIITKIDNKADINVLLEKYFNKYLQNCKNAGVIPDAAFIAPFISKYGLYGYKAWENFKEKSRYIKRDEEIKQKELEQREREDSDLWQDISKMSGNELLQGNKILVYAGARESDFHAGFEATIEKYGYNKKDFNLILQYDKMAHKEVSLKNVAAVILGPHPHNTIKNSWIPYVEVGMSEYPKGFKASYDSGLTAEEFRDKLEEVTFYLRTVVYDERKAFE